MRFFTRSPDLEAQATNRIRSRSRTRSQSISQSSSPQTPRTRSRTRSTSTTHPRQATSTSLSPTAPLSKALSVKTLGTLIPQTPVLSKPAIPYDNSLLGTGSFKTAPTIPSPITRETIAGEKEELQGKIQKFDENDEKKLALLNKYDPGVMEIPVPRLNDVNMHRRMLRAFYLDNLLWATARLQRHVWVAASEQDVYKDRKIFPLLTTRKIWTDSSSLYS
jgi:hypothetical protein